MRRSVTPVIFGFSLLMIAFVYLAQACFIVQLIGVVDRLEGSAQVQRRGAGRWIRLKPEMFVQTGDVMRTGEGSLVELRWLDGTRMRVEHDSRVQVTKATMNNFSKSKQSEFHLDFGTVWVRIIEALSPNSKFEVATPTATSAVRGTVFSVRVDRDGATWVSVFEGKVGLTAGKQEAIVERGSKAQISGPGSGPRLEAQSADDEAQWKRQVGIVSPALNVREPADGAAVSTPDLRIMGTVEPMADLTVNASPVKHNGVKKDQFRYIVRLSPGTNVLRIMAVDSRGAKTEVTRRVVLATPIK